MHYAKPKQNKALHIISTNRAQMKSVNTENTIGNRQKIKIFST